MKKLLIVFFISSIFLLGCQNNLNTPTAVVESFFSKYQKLDKDVLNDLEKVINKEKNMNKEQKKIYKSIMERQYQNLSYKISNEEILNNTATIDVEIEVLDYAGTIQHARKYYFEHPEEFNYTIENDSIENTENYINYKLDKLKEVKEKNKYKFTITLTKEDGIWSINKLSDSDIEKIHGLY